jgi:hypothetical protein
MTYDEALQTLQVMFSSWDRESINAVFQSNDYHMERTIEAILAMNQGGSGAPTRYKECYWVSPRVGLRI